MPSPIGHALGGLAAGGLIVGRGSRSLLLICAAAAVLPDVDFLLPLQHRGPSHSVTAALLAFALTFIVATVGRPSADRLWIALAVAAAYLSHTLLDWLGEDTWSPRGIMALWPWSHTFYISGLDLFDSVNRRYWTPGFWRGNAIAVAREILLLAPIVAGTWWLTARSRKPANAWTER